MERKNPITPLETQSNLDHAENDQGLKTKQEELNLSIKEIFFKN